MKGFKHMPQLTLQYTANINQEIDYSNLFAKLHNILADVGGINIENCKSRALKLNNYYISQGEISNAFIHLDVRFLEGRSLPIKKEIGNQLLEALNSFYQKSLTELDLQFTVEISDIQRELYFKFPLGSL